MRTLVGSVVGGLVDYPPKDKNHHWKTIHSTTLRVICDRLLAAHRVHAVASLLFITTVVVVMKKAGRIYWFEGKTYPVICVIGF